MRPPDHGNWHFSSCRAVASSCDYLSVNGL